MTWLGRKDYTGVRFGTAQVQIPTTPLVSYETHGQFLYFFVPVSSENRREDPSRAAPDTGDHSANSLFHSMS